MEENNDQIEETPVYDIYVTEAPTVKDQIVSATIGAGIGLLVTGVVYGAVGLAAHGYGRLQDRKMRKQEARRLAELEANQETEETE